MGAASGLSLAATGLGAAGSVFNGETQASNLRQQADQTAKMDEFRATQLQDASEYGKAKAGETNAFLQQQTSSMLANIMAVRAAANVGAGGPTGNAILARTQGQQDLQRSIRVGDLDAQAGEAAKESTMYTDAARDTLNRAYSQADNAELGGFLGGLGGIAKGLSGISFG